MAPLSEYAGLRGRHARLLRQSDQLDDGDHAYLLHHAAAMYLNRLKRDANEAARAQRIGAKTAWTVVLIPILAVPQIMALAHSGIRRGLSPC